MRLWPGRVVGVVLLATLAVAPPGVQATGEAVQAVNLYPSEGYSGGLVDLSGTGFKPFRKLILFMACPSYLDPSVYQDGNFIYQTGPTTDAQGKFAGYLFHAPILKHRTPPVGCLVYVSIPQDNQDLAPTSAAYFIEKRSYRVGRCNLTLCVSKVVASPRRVRAGFRERIAVHGWPGARLDIELSYPDHDQHHIQHLDWQGNYALWAPVPERTSDGTSVRVTVRATLGRMQDTGYGNFIVTR